MPYATTATVNYLNWDEKEVELNRVESEGALALQLMTFVEKESEATSFVFAVARVVP